MGKIKGKLPPAFDPESLRYCLLSEMAGLLALPDWWLPSRPYPVNFPGWNSGLCCLQHERITAAGTAPVLHRIPLNSVQEPFRGKDREN